MTDPLPFTGTTARVDRLQERRCAWCGGPIPVRARRDAKFCGTPHRQAHHRFQKGMQLRVATGRPCRFAYADPPYPGMASRYYRDHPDFGGEVDHTRLVEQLNDEFPDGWALSTSVAALPAVLKVCPGVVRVAAWFRGERPAVSYRPLNAWEPVIVHRGRGYLSSIDARRVDALVHVARPRTTDPNRVIGMKPAAFCWWLFDLLGALPGDDLIDLFPGSGGVSRAWALYSAQASSPGGSDTSAGDGHDVSLADRHDASVEYSADGTEVLSGMG